MCCQETKTLNLPPEVIEALAHYRRLLDERGWDWGDEQLPGFFRWARFSLLGPVFDAFAATGDWAKAIRSVIGYDVPPGIVVVRVDEGGELHADVGVARAASAGQTVTIDVVIDSAVDDELSVTVASREVKIAPLGTEVETIDLDGADPVFTVVNGDETLSVAGAIRPSAAAELRLSSTRCSRWSVTDSSGGAWFPEGVLAKWDVHHRPFFHGHDITLAVPAESLHVVCARGIEFERTELDVIPTAGETHSVECDPPRLFDPAAEGDATSELRHETTLEDGPTWIAAVARGGSHPNTLDESVLAHTSPVYIDVAGWRVARRADARWCLEFLDTLEQFVDEHGHFDPATRTAHFGDLVAVLDEARSFYRRVAEFADR